MLPPVAEPQVKQHHQVVQQDQATEQYREEGAMGEYEDYGQYGDGSYDDSQYSTTVPPAGNDLYLRQPGGKVLVLLILIILRVKCNIITCLVQLIAKFITRRLPKFMYRPSDIHLQQMDQPGGKCDPPDRAVRILAINCWDVRWTTAVLT